MERETAMAVHAIVAVDRWFARTLACGTANEPPVIAVMAVNTISCLIVNCEDWISRMTGGAIGTCTADPHGVRPGVVIIEARGNGRVTVNAVIGDIALPAGGTALQGMNLGRI